MNRKALAVVGAVVVTLLGVTLLVSYVNGADSRARAGEQTVRVLVVADPIGVGTAAADIEGSVRSELVPRAVRAADAVSSLDQIQGLVATVDLVPGEQVLSSRFSKPNAKTNTEALLQKISVSLDAERVVGGTVSSGDLVAVYISTDSPAVTGLALHQVPVVSVQKPATTDQPGQANQKLTVTVALDAQQATTFVWGIEHGTIWLSLEPKSGGTGISQPVSGETVFP